MPGFAEVDANLVGPPGFEPAFDQRKLAERFDHFHVCDRVLPLFRIGVGGATTPTVAPIPNQRRFDPAVHRHPANQREIPPFLAAIALFLLGYAGIVISVFPYLVPPSLTIWDTAAAPSSQRFMLIGTLALLPVILGYVVFVYWIFRGKAKAGLYD